MFSITHILAAFAIAASIQFPAMGVFYSSVFFGDYFVHLAYPGVNNFEDLPNKDKVPQMMFGSYICHALSNCFMFFLLRFVISTPKQVLSF